MVPAETQEGLPAQDPDLPRFWIKPFYGSFNGIRGAAVALVFLHHYARYWNANRVEHVTWIGVDIFFVLSGFLITGILYDSLTSEHYFRNFYVRRALRIFPLFYGFFLLLFVLTPILHLNFSWNLLSFFFYVGNLVVPFTDLARHNPTVVTIASHGFQPEFTNIGALWSLCVEEQFYLIWPAVVWWVRDRRQLMMICVVVSVLILGLRFYLNAHASPQAISQYLLLWSSYTRFDSLLVGAWLGLFLRGRALSLRQLRRASGLLFWASACALVAGTYLFRSYTFVSSPFTRTAGYTLLALASAGILLRALDDDGLLARALRNRYLTGLGVISYGFYFVHGLPDASFESVVRHHPQYMGVVPPVAFALAVGIAWLSFRYFETPFLRLKKRWAPQDSAKVTAEGFVPARLHVSEPEA